MKISIIAISLLSLFSSAGKYEGVIGVGHQFGGALGGSFLTRHNRVNIMYLWGM
jgi:hypothetical protein